MGEPMSGRGEDELVGGMIDEGGTQSTELTAYRFQPEKRSRKAPEVRHEPKQVMLPLTDREHTCWSPEATVTWSLAVAVGSPITPPLKVPAHMTAPSAVTAHE